VEYQTLYDHTIEHGGATVDMKDGSLVGFQKVGDDVVAVPKSGFVVGTYDGSFAVVKTDDTEAFDTAIDRLLTQAPRLGAGHIGTWVSEGDIYIDPVRVFANRDIAIGYAMGTGQKAIYDLANGVDIPIRGA
jgi:hypothetical protein